MQRRSFSFSAMYTISDGLPSIGLPWKPMFGDGATSCSMRDRSGEQFLLSITSMQPGIQRKSYSLSR